MSDAGRQVLALLGRVGADEAASSFAFVAAVAAGVVPSSTSAPAPVTYGQVCACRHLSQEHKSDGELTLCLGDSFVVMNGHRVAAPCGCRSWRRVQPPLSQFRPEEEP